MYFKPKNNNCLIVLMSVWDDPPYQDEISEDENNELPDDNRIIPGHVQIEVYKRDKGHCVKCGSKDYLHLDYIYLFAKGGTSKYSKNIQLLCRRHNLKKSHKVGGWLLILKI